MLGTQIPTVLDLHVLSPLKKLNFFVEKKKKIYETFLCLCFYRKDRTPQAISYLPKKVIATNKCKMLVFIFFKLNLMMIYWVLSFLQCKI